MGKPPWRRCPIQGDQDGADTNGVIRLLTMPSMVDDSRCAPPHATRGEMRRNTPKVRQRPHPSGQ